MPATKTTNASPLLALTLREAFEPGLCPPEPANRNLNLERSLRSISFLLNALTEDGNKPLAGDVARGLGASLRICADYVAHAAGRGEEYEGPCLQSV